MANKKTERKTTSKTVSAPEPTQVVPEPVPVINAEPSVVKVKKTKAKAVKTVPTETSSVVPVVTPSVSAETVVSRPTTVKAPRKLKVVKKEPVVENHHDEEEEEVGKRYFKCIMINSNGEAHSTGRYSGKKPKQAASKACTRLYEECKVTGKLPERIVFGMHECTRSSKKKKKYFYAGCRVELGTPEEVEISKIDPKTGKNMIIKYYYNNDVRKLTDVDKCAEYPILFNYDVKEEEEIVAPVRKLRVVKKNTKAVVKRATKKEVVCEPAQEVVPVAVSKEDSSIKVKKSVKATKTASAKATTKATKTAKQ